MSEPSSTTSDRLRRLDDATVERWLQSDPEQFNDVVRLDIENPGGGSFDIVGADGYCHAMLDPRGNGEWILAIAAAPTELGELLDMAAGEISRRGGGNVTWWRAGADAAVGPVATRASYRTDRQLLRLDVGLPVDPRAALPEGIELRSFVVGADDEAWLAVNNAAFADHPEQSSWTPEILRARCAEPWFDPELFLVATRDDAIVGFNWLKPHLGADRTDAIGEIYVIGVAPDAQGSGLGRALVVAGLERLARKRFGRAMLYVAADNDAAIGLYRSLGFRLTRTDQAFTTTIRPA